MGLFDLFRQVTDYERAEQLMANGRQAEAIPYFLRAIERNQETALAALKLGLCYHSIERFADAEKCYLASARTNPANAKAWELLSLVQVLNARFEEAEASAKAAIEASLEPNQLLVSKMALIQAIVNQIAAIGAHRDPLHCANEQAAAEAARTKRFGLINRVLPIIDESLKCGVHTDELWKFRALVGLYLPDSNILGQAMRMLKSNRSPHFASLQDEYRRAYSHPMDPTLL